MKKNVLFILGSFNRGGAERVISVISRQLAEEGYGVTILLLLQYKVDYEMHKDIRIIDLSGNDKSRLLHTFFWIKNIRKHVKESNPDSIVAFFARINILTILACLGLKKKLIISERNDPQHDGRGFMVNVATRVLYPLADKVVFQTKRVSSYFPYLSNATIIFNPISVSSVSKNTNLKKIVTVGRLTVQKNQKLLIESFSEVLKKYPNIILEIYGDGEKREELKYIIKTLGVSNNVIFKGNILNVHEAIADAGLFVLSSDYEGLSNALMEAMMMGLPCISTTCAGSDELISDGKNGILVPVGDKEKMTTAINLLLNNDVLRLSLGKQAKIDSENYSVDKIYKKWKEIL